MSYLRSLIILRGIPGSGKSTYARYLKTTFPLETKVVSADDYFLDASGIYRFDKNKLTAAHNVCFEAAREAMRSNVKNILVDNTNTTEKEYDKYIDLAKDFDYKVTIVTFYHDENNLQIYADRNTHRVPIEVISTMAKRFIKPASYPGPEIIHLI
jgi:predicted kinase